MSDDEVDLELLDLLRQSLGIGKRQEDGVSSDTGVLQSAEYIYNNSVDVSLSMNGTKAAAAEIYRNMRQNAYSTESWAQVEFHPNKQEGFDEVDIVNFVFTMDLLNFSFWSELSAEERFSVEYRGKICTGYKSLLACLRRALDEGIPITNPAFWVSSECTDEVFANVFRSATNEQIPLLGLRVERLREAGNVLTEHERAISEQLRANTEAFVQDFSWPDENEDFRSEIKQEDHDDTLGSVPGTHDQAIDNEVSIDIAQPETSNAIGAKEMAQNEEPPAETRQYIPVDPSEETTPKGESETSPQSISESRSIDSSLQGTSHGTEVTIGRFERYQTQNLSVVHLLEKAEGSAGKLVNLLAKHFQAFQDEGWFEGRKVRFLKRAQILVADLWAAFNGSGYGEFHDIDNLTMFADYRVPQMLHSLGVLLYSPALEAKIRSEQGIASGHAWEMELRGCSIWAVEKIRRIIAAMQEHGQAQHNPEHDQEHESPPPQLRVNAVLIDFFLYDLAKERELAGSPMLPHHRTRTGAY